MGKSEIDSMRPRHLDVRPENGKKPWNTSSDRKKLQQDANNFSNAAREVSLPPNMELFSHQVAGHMQDGVNLGLIKCNNKVYKPILKEACGRREIGFYEQLKTTRDPMLLELKKHTAKYHGTEVLTVDGKPVKYIVLDDITKDFKEPCVMDIKIGRRTYDPLASYDKIIKEDQKYHETKRDLGFCIPGFQVFKVSNGRICRYGKDYGKNLNKESVVDAFKIFLNANIGSNRTLIVHILTLLWCIQNWARQQRHIRLFSSSVLIVYDAKRLKQSLNSKQLQEIAEASTTRPELKRFHSMNRPLSIAFNDHADLSKTSFSGLLTKDGPILGGPASPTRIKQFSPLPERKTGPPSLKRMHSFQNNYDKDLQSMKTDYDNILDQLVNTRQQLWATVKIIDFAHVFPAENCEPDTNFLEGIDNLVKIFEAFLMETDTSLNNNNNNKNVNGNASVR